MWLSPKRGLQLPLVTVQTASVHVINCKWTMIFHINSEKYRVCVVDQMCSYAVVREPYRSCVSSNISTFSADPPGPVGGGILCCVGEIWFGSFFLFFVCLALLCFTVAESVLSLALCSGGRATGTLGAICFRKEAMKSTPTLLGDRDQLVFKFSYILSGKTETPRTLAFRTCFGISLKTSVRFPSTIKQISFCL